MTERAVKQNPEEAARLYARGVGAARAGQRALAASLLGRAVQLDPRHEQAWLWLSGVLDDHDRIAFCLRSVLSINPNNQRAQQGLVWLEQRNLIAAQPAPVVAVPAPVVEAPQRDQNHHERDHWWVGFRRNRREMSHAWRLVWFGLIVLLACTLGLNLLLRETIAQARVEPTAVVAGAVVVPSATAVPTAVPILQPVPNASDEARALAYLSAFERRRTSLREATVRYREQTAKLGNSAVLHAAAARELRNDVDAAYSELIELSPPPALAMAHISYLEGLDEQRSAMDDMLDFYGSFNIQLANRAVLRLEDASEQIDRARVAFAIAQSQANAAAAPSLTIR